MKKGILTLSVLAFVLVLVVGIVGTVNFVQASESYVVVDVNPSIEFVVNRNDIVLKANALNADASVVLSGLSLNSMRLEEAIDLFLMEATQLGFVDTEATETDPNAVLITVQNPNFQHAQSLKNRLLNYVDDYMLNNGIWGVAFSAETMQSIVAEAEELGISAGKLRMINAVQIYYPEKTTDELLAMSIRQLIKLVREKNPADVIVSNYQERLNILTSIPEPERTEEQLQQILIITENLSNIQALQAFAQTQKDALKQTMQQNYNQYLENKQERVSERVAEREQFKNNLQERLQQILQNKFQNRFNNG